MAIKEINVQTNGERFYEITDVIRDSLVDLINQGPSGILHLFIQHTSCALCMSEAFDPTAKEDCEEFLKYLVPRKLQFIKHTTEGPDDSPSHMKSIILHQHIALIVDQKKLLLGTWQGIYLAEFRDRPHHRKILIKYQAD